MCSPLIASMLKSARSLDRNKCQLYDKYACSSFIFVPFSAHTCSNIYSIVWIGRLLFFLFSAHTEKSGMLELVRCDLPHKAIPDRDHRSIKMLNKGWPTSINDDTPEIALHHPMP